MKAVLSLMVLVIIFGFTVSTHADYDQPQQRYNHQVSHLGLYLGGGLGSELPVGDCTEGVLAGFGWAIRIGYQFMKYLAVELGYNQGVGSISNNGVTGIWSFVELPYLDIKPNIPLSSASDLYFLVGIADADNSVAWRNPNITYTLGPDIGADFGIGYEYYITNNWSLGGEIIYHYLASKKESQSPGGSITPHSAQDGSATALNFVFLYHF